MEKRQKLLGICKIFNDCIETEVRKYFNQSDAEKSKITFFNIKGDMLFLDKYQLIGDGDGGNEVLQQINTGNTYYETPTFIISGDSLEMDNFLLHLEHPSGESLCVSYFIKETHEHTNIYRLNSVEMLESEEFKSCIIKMFKDIAPERLKEVEQLLVA